MVIARLGMNPITRRPLKAKKYFGPKGKQELGKQKVDPKDKN